MQYKEIALIMPVYKAHKTIHRALSSVLIQTRLDLVKVVMSVDGESEGTYDYLYKDFPKLDLEIIYNKNNLGPGMARQSGINNSSSKYIVFMDTDDALHDSFSIEVLYFAMERDPKIVFLAGKFVEQMKNGSLVERYADKIFLHGKIYLRSALEKYDIHFDKNIIHNEDVYFNRTLLYLKDNTEKMGAIQETTYSWLWNDNSMVRRNDNEATYSTNSLGVIEAITKVGYRVFESHKESESFNRWIIKCMADFYMLYMKVQYFNPDYLDKFKKRVVTFFNDIFMKIDSEYRLQNQEEIVAQTIYALSYLTKGPLPTITYLKFMEMISNEEDRESYN